MPSSAGAEPGAQGGHSELAARVDLAGLGVSSQRVSTETKRVEYKAGEEQQVNPRYVWLRDRIAALVADIQVLESELAQPPQASANCTAALLRDLDRWAGQQLLQSDRAELAQVQGEFAQTVPYVTNTLKGFWEYQIERHVKTASLRLGVEVADGTMVLQRDQVYASVEDEDSTVANPNPDIGVEADPLELAGDEQLYVDALLPGVAATAEKLLVAVQASLADRQYSEANMAVAEGSQERKLDGFARYLLLAPESGGAKAASAQAQLAAELGVCPESFPGPLSLWNRDIGAFPAPTTVRPLGFQMLDVTPGVAALTGCPARGVCVLRVTRNSVAESAGLRPLDVVLTVDGDPVPSATEFGEQLATSCYRPMHLGIERNGQRLDVDLRKGGDEGRIGTSLWPVTKHVAEAYGVKNGVLVPGVMPKSPAEEAGVKVGDLILALDDIPVSSAERVAELIRKAVPGSQMTVTVSRRGKKLDLPVMVGAASRWTDEQTRLAAERDSVLGSPGPFGLPRDAVGEVQWQVTDGIPQSVASRAGLAPSDGLYVTSSRLRGTPNANRWNRAYPREGDIVLSVNGQTVTSLKQYEQLTDGGTARYWFFIPENETGKAYVLKLWRDGYEGLVVLQR